MTAVESDRRYTKDHEWVLDEEGTLIVGISDHAQSELGDITFIELPDEGMELHQADEAANIESVKAASPVYAPCSGTVVEVNVDLDDTPENVNHDPYGAGWIFKLEAPDTSCLADLMDAEAYEAFVEESSE